MSGAQAFRRPTKRRAVPSPHISPFKAGIKCRCPRCGTGPLFSGYLTVAKTCPDCDLDYARVDSGDGPAVFIILIVGFIVAFSALIVEVKYEPSYWVHAVLWLPLILLLSLGLLRPFKGVLIALQYHHRAGEGQSGSGHDDWH